jgi:hypothetical protein
MINVQNIRNIQGVLIIKYGFQDNLRQNLKLDIIIFDHLVGQFHHFLLSKLSKKSKMLPIWGKKSVNLNS